MWLIIKLDIKNLFFKLKIYSILFNWINDFLENLIKRWLSIKLIYSGYHIRTIMSYINLM